MDRHVGLYIYRLCIVSFINSAYAEGELGVGEMTLMLWYLPFLKK
jgi:hypothetical protein